MLAVNFLLEAKKPHAPSSNDTSRSAQIRNPGAREQGIRLQYKQAGKPQQSSDVERFNRTLGSAWLA